ncbi:MAG: hypothetical protein QXI17_04365 [Candidatus Bilamarchaeaceae archaeon]
MKSIYINTKKELANSENLLKKISKIYNSSSKLKKMEGYALLVEDLKKREEIIIKNKILMKYQSKEVIKFFNENKDSIIFIQNELRKNKQYELLEPLQKVILQLNEKIKQEDYNEVLNKTILFCKIMIVYVITSFNNHLMDIKNKEYYGEVKKIIDEFQKIQKIEIESHYLIKNLLDEIIMLLKRIRLSEEKTENQHIICEDTLEKKVKDILNNLKFVEGSRVDPKKVAEKLKKVEEEYKKVLEIRLAERKKSYEMKKEKLPESIRKIFEQELEKEKKIYTLYFENNIKMLLLVGMDISELFDLHTEDGKGLFMNVNEKNAIKFKNKENAVWLVPLKT